MTVRDLVESIHNYSGWEDMEICIVDDTDPNLTHDCEMVVTNGKIVLEKV